MSARTIASAVARNVASTSRQTLPLLTRQAASRRVHAQLGSESRMRAYSSMLPGMLPVSKSVQRRTLRTASVLHDDGSRIEAFIPETSARSTTDGSSTTNHKAAASIPVTGQRTPIAQIEQRLAITFTCTVDACGHRSSHEFSKRSYTKGIVIVQCPGCKNRHLIADNLSWFTETEQDPRTIEQMIEAKGGTVRRGTLDGETGETIEILS